MSLINKKILILILVTVFISACENETLNPEREKPSELTKPQSWQSQPYLKAVHYYSDTWPVVFWSAYEKGKVIKDFERIKKDGFNTIILIIPWRGFEVNFDDEKTVSDQRLYQRLSWLLKQIDAFDFNIIMRIGYAFNFSSSTNIGRVDLCTNIYTEPKALKQWNHYLHNLASVSRPYMHRIRTVMLSWEDFWCPHNIFPLRNKAERLKLAQSMEYAQWLDVQSQVDFVSKPEADSDSLMVPVKTSSEYYWYYRFIDELFNQRILKTAKNVFPMASVEVRVDKVLINTGEGNKWFSHDLYLSDTNLRATYWAPFWGAKNQGEKLNLHEVMNSFEYFLKEISNQGQSINHIIGQFNFKDNTPHFKHNAVIVESQITSFLKKAAPLLKKYSKGYGLWTYRDYRDNAIYNASFELGLSGWDVVGEAQVVKTESENKLYLAKGSSISQTYNPERQHTMPESYSQLNFCVHSEGQGRIKLMSRTESYEFNIKAGESCHGFSSKELTSDHVITLTLQALDNLNIDEIVLYGFVQKLGVYDFRGNPGPYLQAIQDMNKELH